MEHGIHYMSAKPREGTEREVDARPVEARFFPHVTGWRRFALGLAAIGLVFGSLFFRLPYDEPLK